MQRDALLLTEIVGSIERILEITRSGSPGAIEEASDRRDALLWNFTVLGEAANQVPSELKERSPALPWADASRTRNRIVHGYWFGRLRGARPDRPGRPSRIPGRCPIIARRDERRGLSPAQRRDHRCFVHAERGCG
jgi:uncharacterized protein with HEPN domain